MSIFDFFLSCFTLFLFVRGCLCFCLSSFQLILDFIYFQGEEGDQGMPGAEGPKGIRGRRVRMINLLTL